MDKENLLSPLVVRYGPRKHPASWVVFVLGTPDCPTSLVTVKEAGKVFATHFSIPRKEREIFKQGVSVLDKRTVQVRLKTPESAQKVVDKKNGVMFGEQLVFAERTPKEKPSLFLCDFMDNKVPEEELKYAIRALLASTECQIDLLRYPESKYLIRFTKPVEFLRIYVDVPWSDTDLCVARFQHVDTSTPHMCPICHNEHIWPCTQAEKL